MIGHLFNSLELTRKKSNNKIKEKHIIVRSEKSSRGITYFEGITIYYGEKENIQWFANHYIITEEDILGCYRRTNCDVKTIGNTWNCSKVTYNQYPSIMQCYFCDTTKQNGLPMLYVIIPISSSTAIYLNACGLNAIRLEKPMVFKNAIIGKSLKLTNDVSLSLLNSAITGERSRLERCKAQIKNVMPSLEDAISFLESCNIYDSIRPLKTSLEGTNLAKYHLSMIAVFNHMIKRLEKC